MAYGIEDGIKKVERRVQPVKRDQKAKRTIQQPAPSSSSNMDRLLTPIVPVFAGIAQLFLVIVLFFSFCTNEKIFTTESCVFSLEFKCHSRGT